MGDELIEVLTTLLLILLFPVVILAFYGLIRSMWELMK